MPVLMVMMRAVSVTFVMIVVSVDMDMNLCGPKSLANDRLGFEMDFVEDASDGLVQKGQRHARVDQGAQRHVAADSRKAIEIGNSHRGMAPEYRLNEGGERGV